MPNPISKILFFIYQKLPIQDFGLALLFLAIFLKIIFFPFDIYFLKTKKKTEEIQKKINQIKTLYKDNPERRLQEIFSFYSKEKINPFFPFLLIFIQFPVLIAIFKALNGPFPQNPLFFGIFDLSSPNPFLSLFAVFFQILFGEKINFFHFLLGVLLFSVLISLPSSFSLFLLFNSILSFFERSLIFKKWI